MNYIPVRAYDNYITANLVLGMLREAGIVCHIKDEYTITIDPLLSPAIGGMKLMVAENDLDQALSLLQQAEQLHLESVPCPVCGSHNLQLITEVIRPQRLLGRLRLKILYGQEQETKKSYQCQQCGAAFDELPDVS